MKIGGRKVVNAVKPVVLHILPKDVSKGDNKNPGGCAAAQACLRELGVDEARVHIGRTYLRTGNTWKRYHTSKALRGEIIAFDRGGKFEPGEYALGPIQPSKRTGKQQGTNAARKQRAKPKIARVKYHRVTGIRAHGAAR